MTYYANFTANNGTRLIESINGTNKNKLIKHIRDIAESERFVNNECQWSVYIIDKYGLPKDIAIGGMRNNGARYRIM